MPGNLRYGGQNSARPVPKRAMSLDSLHDKNASLDLKVHEYIPSRITRTSPKINESAMQFVKIQPNPSHLFQRSKTGPAVLYKSATEQIKKAEAVKAMRQHLIDEEADWQAQPSSSSSSKNPYDEGSDWQSNLDKWKSSRRKRNEEALIRAIEIKKHEQEEELIRMRRKSKTFSEIQEDKSKRGRRYNLVVHNDDSSDLSGLGLSSAKSTSSLSDAHEENDVKDLDQDNKDAKSDAGFCTGSDTGSDGVFAEDNISDTSSALGDKKEAHDSLLDTGVSKEEDAHLNGHGSSLITDVFHSTAATIHTDEYTYDKAIAGYKQYAENSAKKRTSSITSLNSNTSYTKDDDRKDEKICVNGRSPSPNKSNKVEEKLNFFSKEMEKDFRSSPEPRVIMREKSPRVDVGKRRSMFETRDPSPHSEKEQRIANRRSLDVSNSLRHKVKSFENLEIETPRVRGITPTRDTNLRNKVASFENLDAECTKVRTITPTRDAKFYEKRASFAAKDYETQPIRKKTPERDVNFHRKLASFTSIENREEDKVREIKTIPQRDPTLRTKIASFEQLEQSVDPRSSSPREEMLRSRDRSVSLEHLNEPQAKEVKIRPARSLMNITRRMPSTPYMVVDLEGSGVEEKCVMETKPMVNAQVFELASKLEETPLLGSPIHKAPTDLPPVSLTHEDDSFEGAKPYTDDDINEVISDYEQVSGAYEDSSGCAENIYENITEEPMYENIYEKVDDESHSESQDTVDEHHYQTLEEVREEVKVNAEQVKVPPSVPASSISPPVLDTPEVLDVTWTDGPSQAAPPSEPPPPPPPDDDSDIDASDEPQSLPTEEEDAFTRESSTRRLKKELWRRRSDFLGTSSQYIEEETVKPPPDLSDLLRQERDSERCLLESQVSRNSIQEILSEAEIVRREREIIESLERSEQQKQQQHEQYIWDDGLQENITNETKTENDEHMQYQEAKNLQTSFELDKESRVPMRVPVTSTNVLESSHSVSKTTDAEHWQMNYDSLGSSSTVLKSTLNTEKTHAELLESHIAKSETIAEAPPHSSMRSESQTSAETEGLLPSESREQYEGHLVAHSSTLDYSDDSLVSTSSHPEEYKKLAELEEEMMRHDKDMLRRTGQLTNGSTAGSDSQPSVNSSLSSYATHGEHSPFPLHHFPQSTENSNYNFQQQSSSHLPIQEFYTAPTYESAASASMVQGEGVGTFRPPLQKSVPLPAGSPSQYSTLASPHPFSRSNSQSSLESSKHPPVQAMRSVPLASPRESIPEPLPRKKKAPPPTPSKSLKLTSELNNAERLEAIRVSRMPTTVSVVTENDQIESQGPSVSPSGQQMSKQTLLALSAIPKPRLTDNESWITKKKPDAQKRDYSKHWLHQEAEQRRLEQQDRISRQKLPVAQPQPKSSQNVSPQQTSHNSTLPQITSYPPTQNTSNYTPQNSSSTYSNYPQSLRNPSPSQSCNNNTTTSSWRNQATTYQPHIPSPAPNGDKALPDSIIHNLTQRVNNKNSKNTYTNASGRLGNNYGSNSYRDENYHDYMNADALSVSHTHAPLYQSGMGPGQPSPPTSQQEANSAKDQRLLSVSGKKKCSHCSEELGRGAAMIIESLRLFYHIPCFKCCVCGIQLGNGSAGADVRVRNHKLHCHNCYSNDEGMKFSKV
ncbi:uro-adherence factor A isoform X4 [Cherax quadricarinatus]|uniref:uro-adherence factor A isoform X4 n=1 Tax=Cherax quadricarinatus TaxID=27406 RepID=UPI0023791538|nr:protein piccolo-like isoform X4 [Cherax quadricarinatus]